MIFSNYKKLNSKNDYEKLLLKIISPVDQYFSKGCATVDLPNYRAASYDDKRLSIETFSRLLWGIAPLSKTFQGEIIEKIKVGILNGTNPECDEYWGEITDYDQILVEMVPIAMFLYFSKEKFWYKLSVNDKERISTWLLQCNSHITDNNNWVFFSLLVNTILKKLGSNYSQKRINKNLSKIEKFYLGNGWYSDGISDRIDYYTSFSIHYYSLIYAVLIEEEDVTMSIEFKNRAKMFATEFVYWFSENGSTIPFGRSLTYRFAQVSFWSAMVYAKVDSFDLGTIKGIINRNIKWWLEKPIFNHEGLLTLGYAYDNINIAEDYNGTGSPYWGLKIFLVLALDENHQFWSHNEKPFPKLKRERFQKEARMKIVRENEHIVSFINGQQNYSQVHGVSKYEKFVYSNIFGFSVPRSNLSIEQGAYDSTLFISYDSKSFIPRSSVNFYKNNEDVLFSNWIPSSNTKISTFVVPSLPWHIRIHKIESDVPVYVYDAGFSIERKSHLRDVNIQNKYEGKDYVIISYSDVSIGTVSLLGNGIPKHIYPAVNTNVMYPRSELSVLEWKLDKGNYIVASAFMAKTNKASKEDYNNLCKSIKINVENNIIKLEFNNKELVIDYKDYDIPKATFRLKGIKKIKKIIKKHIY